MGAWGAKVAAKKVAREAEIKANAKSGTYTANKKLADGVVELENIRKYQAETRAEWYKMAVRWLDNGTRGFKGTNTIEVTQFMDQRAYEHAQLVDKFCNVYPSMVAGKQYDLGADYNQREYPPVDVIRRKFKFNFDYFTIPNTENDIRHVEGIPPEKVESMIAAAEDRLQKRVQGALSSAASQLFKCVQAMQSKLSVKIGEEGHIFRDSLVENLVEIVAVMPNLNITNDPALNSLIGEAKKLTVYSPEILRDDAIQREVVAKQAGALAAKLSSMFAMDTEEE
jgi:hypothetical protein